jgi:multidrug efflux pump subunit AcrA (membrane-fusion protein)
VKMSATGKLSAVNVRVGETVKAGQILADLDPVAKTQAQVNLLEGQDALEKAQKNRTVLDYPRATDAFLKDLGKRITNAKQVVNELETNYKHAEDPQLRSQVLASLTTAKDDLKNLQSNMNWYTSKPTESDITNADSDLALAQAKYDAAEAILETTYQAEASLFTVGDPKALEVIANVTEEDYPLLSNGQNVEIYFDAQPDANVQGKVDRIIPKRIEGDHPLYNIYITLDSIPDGLADGMTADTAITIAHRDGVLCLPRAVVRASSGDTTTVKVWDGTQETSKQIKIGLRGDTYVEIVSGLEEGDQVVTR